MALGLLRFTNAANGTADFIYPGPATDMQSPASAGAVNGTTYLYYAQSLDMTEWEIGKGVYTAGSGTFARTTITANDLGTAAKINFTNPPQVIVFDTFPAADLSSYATLAFVLANYVSATAAQSFTAAQMAQARANIGVLKKNYAINGGMMVSQENGTTAGTTTGYYPVDQWRYDFSNAGSISVAQVASQTPGGSPFRIRATVTAADASVGAGDFAWLLQPIEGLRVADLKFGGANAKQVTVQFGVKAPAGTYGVSLRNGSISGATVSRSGIQEFTIAVGEANTDVVKTVTFSGDTAGAWASDTTAGINISIALMAGSTFQGTAGVFATVNAVATSNQFNFMGTNGNVLELFDVGIYEGGAAPAFALNSYDFDLRECMRYWQCTNPGAPKGGGIGVLSYATPGTNYAVGSWSFVAPMRAVAAVTFWNGGAQNKARITGTGVQITMTSPVVLSQSIYGIAGIVNSAANFTAGGAVDLDAQINARM